MLASIGIDSSTAQGIFWLCSLYSFCAVTVIWAVGLMQGNHSLMDGYYGFGYVIPGWMAFTLSDAKSQTAALLLLMVSLHGARLGVYLARRWGVYRRTIGADPRYITFKKNLSPGYWWKSFFLVMHSQTVVLIVVSLPAIFGIAMTNEAPGAPIGWLTAIGMLVYGLACILKRWPMRNCRPSRLILKTRENICAPAYGPIHATPIILERRRCGGACIWWPLPATLLSGGRLSARSSTRSC